MSSDDPSKAITNYVQYKDHHGQAQATINQLLLCMKKKEM